MLKLTKKQLEKLDANNIGEGYLIIKTADNEIKAIEIYTNKKKKIINKETNEEVFPIKIFDNGTITGKIVEIEVK